jgi:peptidyl-prolyl cis-trans isomerase C
MHFKKRLPAALFLSLLITTAAAPVAWSAPQKVVQKTVAVPPAVEKKDGVVAVVNGSDIGTDDFYRELNRVQRLVLQTGKPLTCARISRLRTQVVEGLVRREILAQEARRSIRLTDAEINAELKKLRDRYPSESDFTSALAVMKISPAALRSQVERALSIKKLIETQFASKVVVTDRDLWAYYDRNRDSFRQPEQVRASHILIKVDPKWDASKKAAARKKIEEIQQKIRQKQEFESLARTYSEDASRSKGGDLGYVRTGQVLKPFEEALFVLSSGEVSDIVETRLGYHLIKAGDRKPEMTIPFDALKEQLRAYLKQEKGQQEANAHIDKLREKAKVQISLPADTE